LKIKLIEKCSSNREDLSKDFKTSLTHLEKIDYYSENIKIIFYNEIPAFAGMVKKVN